LAENGAVFFLRPRSAPIMVSEATIERNIGLITFDSDRTKWDVNDVLFAKLVQSEADKGIEKEVAKTVEEVPVGDEVDRKIEAIEEQIEQVEEAIIEKTEEVIEGTEEIISDIEVNDEVIEEIVDDVANDAVNVVVEETVTVAIIEPENNEQVEQGANSELIEKVMAMEAGKELQEMAEELNIPDFSKFWNVQKKKEAILAFLSAQE